MQKCCYVAGIIIGFLLLGGFLGWIVSERNGKNVLHSQPVHPENARQSPAGGSKNATQPSEPSPPSPRNRSNSRKTFTNIHGTGVDAVIRRTAQHMTIEFSAPVLFASFRLTENIQDAVAKALNQAGTLIDTDIGTSELNVFGDDIVTVIIAGISGTISEMSFIPQP